MAYNFSTLTAASKSTEGSIRYWVQHDLIPADNILTKSEAWIYEKLRVPDMIVTQAISLAAGDSTLTKPTGFLDPLWMRFDGDVDEVDYRQENLLERFRDVDGDLIEGHPSQYSLINDRIEFDVAADEALEGDFCFYKIPTALSVSNETNFLTIRFPSLLEAVCLGWAYAAREQHDKSDKYLKIAGGLLEEANMSADRARRGQRMR